MAGISEASRNSMDTIHLKIAENSSQDLASAAQSAALSPTPPARLSCPHTPLTHKKTLEYKKYWSSQELLATRKVQTRRSPAGAFCGRTTPTKSAKMLREPETLSQSYWEQTHFCACNRFVRGDGVGDSDAAVDTSLGNEGCLQALNTGSLLTVFFQHPLVPLCCTSTRLGPSPI